MNAKLHLPPALAGLVWLSGAFLYTACAHAQKQHYETPDLVVGIIVDQMRPDYIYRYWDKYGDDGIRRLVNQGFSFRNASFRQLQTSTGPGHAAQMTGATPSVHGLIGNVWYDRKLRRTINVIEDVESVYEGVGARPNYRGGKSPANMLTTTVGDELFLHTGERSRTVGISRKDRAAILPAGHTGSAYWYEAATGNFITSTFYHDELPDWLREFNDRNLHEKYLARVWEPLLPIEEYVESRADENPYEGDVGGYSTFPIDLPRLVKEERYGPELLTSTPFGDELLLELAFAAIEGEELGKRGVPDIFTVGFSAADRLGHLFGPASKQVQDYYLRFDRYLARLLDYLDEEFGTENVLVFLTADHGGAYIPHYLRDLRITTGHPNTETHIDRSIGQAVSDYMMESYGWNFLLSHSNHYLYLDHDFMDRDGLDHEKVRTDIKRFVLTLDPVAGAITADALNNAEFTEGIRARAQHSFHQKRSGDVAVWLKPQTRPDTGTGGTGHGTGWVYDTHVPLIFYGYDIPYGQSAAPAHVSDIAPTLSLYLNSPFPSGNIGNPLNDHMKRE